MGIKDHYDPEKLRRVKKRVDKMKGFYVHLAVYLLVNGIFQIQIYIASSRDGEGFWEWGHFFMPIFWGLGLAFHGIKAFNFNPFFGKNWEERQIQKYLEKERREADKFK
ncbi:MAG TPA: 2TM domain-containing protein [Eudoraea sp.]|nr:2TM domain-containing protein [Eudoraea sp.]